MSRQMMLVKKPFPTHLTSILSFTMAFHMLCQIQLGLKCFSTLTTHKVSNSRMTYCHMPGMRPGRIRNMTAHAAINSSEVMKSTLQGASTRSSGTTLRGKCLCKPHKCIAGCSAALQWWWLLLLQKWVRKDGCLESRVKPSWMCYIICLMLR